MNAYKLTCPQIAIDGVFFQLGNGGIARVWTSLLREWVKSGFSQHLVLLDRGGTAPQIPGINYYPIDRYEWDRTALDSFRLQEICDRADVDLFMPTYYTQAISTPSILLVHDMIPEVIGADLNEIMWQEKHYAICSATKYITVSQNTARDLCRFYPQIPTSAITGAYNGVDPLFAPSQQPDIDQFLTSYGITPPYFLVVGDRVGLDNYKNAIHFFRAMAELPDRQRFKILCVGGETQLEPELVHLSQGMRVCQLSLSDRELQLAYSGATALVYPSRYEGFGLPVLEAMACGCPVITCKNSALPEVAGDAAMYVSESDVSDLVTALKHVQQPEIRQQLITKGLDRARQFSWKQMADTIAAESIATYEQLQQGKLPPVNPLWLPLRQLQASKYPDLDELQQVRQALAIAQEQIASMETSKFWRLRQRWFQLKKKLRCG